MTKIVASESESESMITSRITSSMDDMMMGSPQFVNKPSGFFPFSRLLK